MTTRLMNRERLEEIVSDPMINQGSEFAMMARMALAAMDSEPVAVCIVEDGQMCPDGFGECDHSLPDGTHELFAAPQPAPVVLKDHQIRELVNQLRDIAIEYHGTQQLRERIARVLRAAMLQAEPVTKANKLGNSPVIPDRWIPVSERMPEAGGDMIVFTDGIVMSGISYAKKKGFYIQALEYDDDEPVDNVTHWMPLPAAPQKLL